jgi:hypothetical protein
MRAFARRVNLSLEHRRAQVAFIFEKHYTFRDASSYDVSRKEQLQ